MARANEPEGILRGCPTCGTKVSEANIGLRDYRWVNEVLPGKVGLMDIDATLTQASTGRVLVLEFKPSRAKLSTGARLTFQTLMQKGDVDVWLVWDQHRNQVAVTALNEDGTMGPVRRMTQKRLAVLIKQWWEEGLDG